MANKKSDEVVTVQSLTGSPFGPTFPIRMNAMLRELISEEAALDSRPPSAWARHELAKLILARRVARGAA